MRRERCTVAQPKQAELPCSFLDLVARAEADAPRWRRRFVTTPANPRRGFLGLFARFEADAGTVAALNRLGSELEANVAGGRCVLCGGLGGDRITPGDPCPFCGKERGE